MAFDFDSIIERSGTGAVKFDLTKTIFGTEAVMPLWVADMDFAIAPCISDALIQRVKHPILGYSVYPDSLYQSIIHWFKNVHDWSITQNQIFMAPGVVPSLFAAVQAFTKEGEGVIVQPPVYFPFFNAVKTANRKLLLNPLKEKDGYYEMDFEHLEQCAKQGAKLMLLCSPHNPVGRVWQEAELQRLLSICRQYGIIILSDEIHADLAYSGHHHVVLDKIATDADQLLTTVAPNKTFNIPGLGLSAIISRSQILLSAMKSEFERLHVSNTNPLSIVAFESAYAFGRDWQLDLMVYLETTRNWAVDFINNEIPGICCYAPEATYLLWLDCRGLGLPDTELKRFFIEKAGLGLNPGVQFGEQGSGFMRLNMGTARANIEQALKQLQQACLKTLQNNS